MENAHQFDFRLLTYAEGSGRGRVFTAVCLCVCLSFRTIYQKPMQLG